MQNNLPGRLFPAFRPRENKFFVLIIPSLIAWQSDLYSWQTKANCEYGTMAGKSAKWISIRKVMFCIYYSQCSQMLLMYKRVTQLIIITVTVDLDVNCRSRIYSYSIHLKKGVIYIFLYFRSIHCAINNCAQIVRL